MPGQCHAGGVDLLFDLVQGFGAQPGACGILTLDRVPDFPFQLLLPGITFPTAFGPRPLGLPPLRLGFFGLRVVVVQPLPTPFQ
ncbi:hypothetical protein BV497_02190 [Fulvimonas soli]|nr:hypothetical protein BV497_02190 [Fulvimonas soli]